MRTTQAESPIHTAPHWLAVLILGLMLAAVSPAVLADDDSAMPPPPVAQVNINTADAETLALALEGVGPARAMDIVAWRDANGPFTSVEQLQEVRGIGPVTVERNRDRILIE